MDSIVAMGIISQLEQSFGALSKTLFLRCIPFENCRIIL
ncbi:hypothetical protein [Bacillus velezensis]